MPNDQTYVESLSPKGAASNSTPHNMHHTSITTKYADTAHQRRGRLVRGRRGWRWAAGQCWLQQIRAAGLKVFDKKHACSDSGYKMLGEGLAGRLPSKYGSRTNQPSCFTDA